jgi:glycosyltransferase involved in cell wall biosynthesis
MRILLFSNSYSPAFGGLQTVARHLAKGFTAQGHEVRVLANRYPFSLPALEQIDGIPVHRDLFLLPYLDDLRRFRPDLFLLYGFFSLLTLLNLTRLMRSFRPDVINIHYPLRQTPFVLWLKRRFPFRLVVSLHGGEVLPSARTGSDGEGLRELLRQADAVTSCSHWLLDQVIQWEPGVKDKGVVIHNGITLERFENIIKYPHPKPYLLAYGRFSFPKGFDLLLDAFAKISKQFPHVDLILAGEGEDREALESQSSALGCSGQVHFLGRATPEEIVELLNGCLFVVIPSRSEAFGIAALEALAAGKPVLATQVGGLTELLNGSSSHLVQPTADGLARGMTEWLALDQLPQPDRQNLVSEYSWERMAADYERVLQGNPC